MAITSSAKKAIRSSARKRIMNLRRKRALHDSVKSARDKKGDLATAYQAIDKALKVGIIKKNAAARKKSRLAKFLKKSAK